MAPTAGPAVLAQGIDKYLRPTQFDSSITLAIGLPNHPSYPSDHAATSGTIAGILGHEFPPEAATLQAMAEEAGLSRIYGGIHYRFDMTVGLELARQITVGAVEGRAWTRAFAIE
jgi:membrane-associated phospholipid phosphatase